MKMAAVQADKILLNDPDLSGKENVFLRETVITRGLKSVDFKTL